MHMLARQGVGTGDEKVVLFTAGGAVVVLPFLFCAHATEYLATHE